MEINGFFIRQALRVMLALATVVFLCLDWPVFQFPNMVTDPNGGVSASFIFFGREQSMIGCEWVPWMVRVVKWGLALVVFMELLSAEMRAREGEAARRRRWERKRRRRAEEERSE